MDTEPTSPAERRRARQRAHVVDVALDLFESKGFDNTSTDEIAEAGDISPRTFFRYFDAKADIVTDVIAANMAIIGEHFVARPADEPHDVAMCEAAVEMLEGLTGADRFVRCISIMVVTPTVQANLVTRPPLEDILATAAMTRDPSLTTAESRVIAAVGAGLLRQPMMLLALSGDRVKGVRELRHVFELGRKLWSTPSQP